VDIIDRRSQPLRRSEGALGRVGHHQIGIDQLDQIAPGEDESSERSPVVARGLVPQDVGQGIDLLRRYDGAGKEGCRENAG